jgi:hypothetical protein
MLDIVSMMGSYICTDEEFEQHGVKALPGFIVAKREVSLNPNRPEERTTYYSIALITKNGVEVREFPDYHCVFGDYVYPPSINPEAKGRFFDTRLLQALKYVHKPVPVREAFNM